MGFMCDPDFFTHSSYSNLSRHDSSYLWSTPVWSLVLSKKFLIFFFFISVTIFKTLINHNIKPTEWWSGSQWSSLFPPSAAWGPFSPDILWKWHFCNTKPPPQTQTIRWTNMTTQASLKMLLLFDLCWFCTVTTHQQQLLQFSCVLQMLSTLANMF